MGFFLNTLHEELLLLHARTTPPSANGAKAAPKAAENGEQEEREVERAVSPGADGADGWLEVGKKQKTNVVRNVSHGNAAKLTARPNRESLQCHAFSEASYDRSCEHQARKTRSPWNLTSHYNWTYSILASGPSQTLFGI